MSNLFEIITNLSNSFKEVIEYQPNITHIPTKDYGWKNYRYCNPMFRLAHIELFNTDKLIVLHTCIFPHVTDPAPIFGFDVIAGESKVTGLFWDLSPTVLPSQPFTALPIERPRQRPEWGDIFGENWIACRPTGDEMIAIADDAKLVLSRYLDSLTPNTHQPEAIIAAQNRYCVQQRKNEHTVRAIKNLLGEELAEEFMTTVLFPTLIKL